MAVAGSEDASAGESSIGIRTGSDAQAWPVVLFPAIENPEKFNEFAAAVAVLDEGMNLAGEQVDAGQQTDRAVTLILMIASETHARHHPVLPLFLTPNSAA
jgi:hypothetical protein